MKDNYKIWIIFSLVIVFIAGIVCGVLLENLVIDNEGKETRDRHKSTHFPSLEMMAEELSLSLEQQDKIRALFSSNEQHFRSLRHEVHKTLSEIRTRMITEIKSVLDDNQNIKFEAMIEKYKAQRKREHEERIKRADRTKQERGEIK